MKRLAARVGESMLAGICLVLAIEAMQWAHVGVALWRDRHK